MTTPHLPLRPLARAAAVACGLAVLLLAGPAGAEIPEGWSDPDPVDGLHVLVWLVAVPLGLFVLITLLVLAPSLAKGGGGPVGGEPTWFGGPRGGTAELEAPGAAGAADEPESTGGASGQW